MEPKAEAVSRNAEEVEKTQEDSSSRELLEAVERIKDDELILGALRLVICYITSAGQASIVASSFGESIGADDFEIAARFLKNRADLKFYLLNQIAAILKFSLLSYKRDDVPRILKWALDLRIEEINSGLGIYPEGTSLPSSGRVGSNLGYFARNYRLVKDDFSQVAEFPSPSDVNQRPLNESVMILGRVGEYTARSLENIRRIPGLEYLLTEILACFRCSRKWKELPNLLLQAQALIPLYEKTPHQGVSRGGIERLSEMVNATLCEALFGLQRQGNFDTHITPQVLNSLKGKTGNLLHPYQIDVLAKESPVRSLASNITDEVDAVVKPE